MRDDVGVLRRSLVAWSGVVALGLGGVLTGCGTASPLSPPTGIDELTIPTPSPDPGDFTAVVDNPWLPLPAGGTWTYEVTGTTPGTLTVTVREQTEDVAGVAATVVDRTGSDGTTTTDYYAQDRRGNVWWLGRGGVWRAGEDGAQAGLAMPADPREGDGWRPAYAPGAVDETTTTVALDGEADTPAGTFGDLVVFDTDSRVYGTPDRRDSYAEGAGLVEEVATTGPVYVARLVSAPGAPAGR